MAAVVENNNTEATSSNNEDDMPKLPHAWQNQTNIVTNNRLIC